MESHLLHLAHQQHRWAQAHLLDDRYDDAIQCHHNAAELLVDAMKSTNSSEALESITLQHNFHLKQKNIIKNKKEQYAEIQKAIENNKLLDKESLTNLPGNDYSKLHTQIFRAMQGSNTAYGNVLLKNFQSLLRAMFTGPDAFDGNKIKKTLDTFMQELLDLDQNLDPLVEQLVRLIEVFRDENMALKERVSYLEKERVIEE